MLKAEQLLKPGFILVLAGSVLFTSACAANKAAQPITGSKATTAQTEGQQKDTIEAAGKIKAKTTKNIILDFEATIQAVNVKEGQRVSQGQELVTLDIHEIQQQILDKENALRLERLQLKKSQNSSLDNAKIEMSGLQIAQAELRRSQEDLAIQEELFKQGAITQTGLETAQRRVEDAEKALAGRQISKGTDFRLNIEIEQEKIRGMESDLKQLKAKLSKSYIKGNKIVCDIKNALIQVGLPVAGDVVQPGMKMLSLVNMDSLIVEADVSEDFIKDVKVGAAVEILPLSDSTKHYKGRVLKIADMGIEKNGETVVQTEISIDNMDQFIKPDFNVDVKIGK